MISKNFDSKLVCKIVGDKLSVTNNSGKTVTLFITCVRVI